MSRWKPTRWLGSDEDGEEEEDVDVDVEENSVQAEYFSLRKAVLEQDELVRLKAERVARKALFLRSELRWGLGREQPFIGSAPPREQAIPKYCYVPDLSYILAVLHNAEELNRFEDVHRLGYQFPLRDITAGAELAFRSVAEHFARGEPTFKKEWASSSGRMSEDCAAWLDECLESTASVGLVPRLMLRGVHVLDVFSFEYPTNTLHLGASTRLSPLLMFLQDLRPYRRLQSLSIRVLRRIAPRQLRIYWAVVFEADEDFAFVARDNVELLKRVDAFHARRGGTKITQPHLWVFSADVSKLLKRLNLTGNSPPEELREGLSRLTSEEYDDLVRIRVETMGEPCYLSLVRVAARARL